MIFLSVFNFKNTMGTVSINQKYCSCLKKEDAYICNNLLKQFHETDQALR